MEIVDILVLVAQIDKGDIFSRSEIYVAMLSALCTRTLDVDGSG